MWVPSATLGNVFFASLMEGANTSLGPVQHRSRSSAERLQAVGHNPHAEVLRVGSIGHGEGGLGPIDLMLTGDAAHLVGRFGEAEQTRSANGVGRKHAAGAVDGKRTTDLGVACVGHLPAPAFFADEMRLAPPRFGP